MTTASKSIAVRPLNALSAISKDIENLKSSVKNALAFIDAISTEEDAKEAFDRIKLVKEWAKIRKVKNEMHDDLLRLEMHLLRKMAVFEYTESLAYHKRSCARFFKNKSDEQIETLISEFGQETTVVENIVRMYEAKEEYKIAGKWVLRKSFATPDSSLQEEEVEDAKMTFSMDSKEAIASILDSFDSVSDTFSIEDMTDLLIENLGIDQLNEDWGLRRGLSELCRKAIMDAPSKLFEDQWTPKYVTCFRRSRHGGAMPVRVPFLKASINEFKQMVDLREQQARDLARATEKLKGLFGYLVGQSEYMKQDNFDVPIGEVLSERDIKEMAS